MKKQLIVTLNVGQLQLIVAEAVSDALAEQQRNQGHKVILLKGRDVALFYQVSVKTLKSWVKEGLIPYYKMKNCVYFKQHEVIAAMKTPVLQKRISWHRNRGSFQVAA